MREFLKPWPDRSLLFRTAMRLEQLKSLVAAGLARKQAGYSGTGT
jgi:hypothetical protein